MCGIIGIASAKPVYGNIIEALKKLEYRGYDSAGLSTLDKGEIKERYFNPLPDIMKFEKAPSMLKAHEAMIAKYFDRNPNTTAKEMTLYLGQLMEDVGRLTSTVVTGLEDGALNQAEQKDIKIAIKKAEQSIVQLKKRIGEEVD